MSGEGRRDRRQRYPRSSSTLLPAAHHLLRPALAGGEAALLEQRWRGRGGGGSRAHYRPDPWPRVRILLRADSGFCREDLMAWCEANHVDYVFGRARNSQLRGEIETEMAAARAEAEKPGKPARRFKDFRWSTRDSWNRIRRV